MFIGQTTIIGPEANEQVLWVEGTGISLRFRSAMELTQNNTAPFKCYVKNLAYSGAQPLIISHVGEPLDVVYLEGRRLKQGQDSAIIGAFVHPTNPVFTGIYTLGGSYNQGAFTGHRTITTLGYEINDQDHGVLHKCSNLAAGGPISITLPPLRLVTGLNPGTTQNSYLSKTYGILKVDNSPHRVSISVPFEDQLYKQIHTNDGSSSIVINLEQQGEVAFLQGMGDGWWPMHMWGFMRAPGH
jgi:hypothetical protein